MMCIYLKHKKFIYTNGTLGHGEESLKHMNLTSQFKDIYARDIIPYMKPYYRSYNHVRNSLLYKHSCNIHDKFIFLHLQKIRPRFFVKNFSINYLSCI